MRVYMRFASISLIAAAVLFAGNLSGCGGPAEYSPVVDQPQPAVVGPGAAPGASDWPAALPADQLQPWEQLNTEGYAVGVDRRASAINADSEFLPGVERFLEAGDVSNLGAASRLASSTAGSGAVSWAQYRFVLGGGQPGVLSTDVNLRRTSGGALSAYWVGLGNYAAGVWEWRGPFAQNHARLPLAEDAYRSPLGNMYVCIVACDGADFDVVGLGVSLRDAVDSSPPPVPAGLSVVAVANGLELAWNPVIADDLAGYRVYYRDGWFVSRQATGIKTAQSLEGQARCVLCGLSRRTYVRIAAIDISGNESELSDFVEATPLPGDPPQLEIATDEVSGSRGLVATLTASGADSYDWDLDGDGIYDITGDTTGTAQADTDSTGLIRPAVRGSSGSSVACGAVSLIISGNIPPVASGFADPSFGPAPLEVSFHGEGTDTDGTVAMYSWDFDGDGFYDWNEAAGGDPPPLTYNTPYLRNAKFRVDDDEGAFNVDTVSVLITESDVWHTVLLDSSTPIVANRIVLASTGGRPACTYTNSYDQVCYVRAEDAEGMQWTVPRHYWTGRLPSLASINDMPALAYFDHLTNDCIYVRATDSLGNNWPPVPTVAVTAGNAGPGCSLAQVNGRPAVACRDITTGNVIYVRASDAAGTSWPAGNVLVGPGGSPGALMEPVMLVVVNGNPAVVWLDLTTNYSLKYARADNANGTSFSAPAELVSSATPTGAIPSLAVVNGRPAVVYSEAISVQVYYTRAQDTTGTNWDTPAVVNPPGESGFYGSLAVIDGIPTISYLKADGDDLVIVRAEDANGASWDSPELVDELHSTGLYNCIAEVSGRPAIAYFDATISGIKYACRTRDY